MNANLHFKIAQKIPELSVDSTRESLRFDHTDSRNDEWEVYLRINRHREVVVINCLRPDPDADIPPMMAIDWPHAAFDDDDNAHAFTLFFPLIKTMASLLIENKDVT